MKLFKFLKTEKFREAKYNILQNLLAHQNFLDIGMSIARSVSSFAQSRSPLSFVEGGVSAFNSTIKLIGGNSDDFFSTSNGWEVLAYSSAQQALYDIILSGLETFPIRNLKFAYEADKTAIYSLPTFSIGKTRRALFFRPKEGTKASILQFIMMEKVRSGKSKIFSVTEKTVAEGGYNVIRFDLKNEESIAMPSKTADDLSAYIKKYLDRGITRSFILNGPPGSGKSTLSHSIIKDLDVNVLKFKYSKSTNNSIINIIMFLVEALKIEAILIDDFDQFGETALLLDFLEWLHRHTKVIIATTNSLKMFAPAVLRPGRFDELRTIEHLDEEVVKAVLGDIYNDFSQLVEKWPIAYVTELNNRVRTNPEANHAEYVKELQDRVNKQYKVLKE